MGNAPLYIFGDNMKFELWSVWHVLYITSPFVIFALIYFLINNRSDKTKNIVGIILGAISILILVVRNLDIFLRSGWGVEVIPLQVCHIGSLIAGLALIFKKKWQKQKNGVLYLKKLMLLS